MYSFEAQVHIVFLYNTTIAELNTHLVLTTPTNNQLLLTISVPKKKETITKIDAFSCCQPSLTGSLSAAWSPHPPARGTVQVQEPVA